MNKRFVILVFTLVIGAAALAGALLGMKKYTDGSIRPNNEWSDEKILELPYFDLVAAAGENPNLPCDVESYSLGDGYIHLYLPENVPEKAVTVYIRDIEGNYLARRVFDFREKVMIGPWEVLLEHHNLPVMYYMTEDPAVYEAMNASESKEILCPGDFTICVNESDAKRNGWYTTYTSINADKKSPGSASLHGRGASSWSFCDTKKSYSLSLERAQNLLGMGSNRNWNLVGNAFDLSLTKNLTFNNVAKEMGIEYQPNMQPVNLYVDGKYHGVYTLTTKITVDKNRIPLEKGDYFYRKHSHTVGQSFSYTSKTWYDDGQETPIAELEYPKYATEDQLERAKEVFQRFIDTVEDPESPDFDEVCDVKALAKYYWIQEASMNYDAWERCVYMYYRKSTGQMVVGPVWDMDVTLGANLPKEGIDFDTPEGWRIKKAGWYTELFKNKEFVQTVQDEYYNGGIRDALMDGVEEFERQREMLGADAYLNFLFYGSSNKWLIPMEYADNYDDYFDIMIDFYKKRIDWIDSQMQGAPAYD